MSEEKGREVARRDGREERSRQVRARGIERIVKREERSRRDVKEET